MEKPRVGPVRARNLSAAPHRAQIQRAGHGSDGHKHAWCHAHTHTRTHGAAEPEASFTSPRITERALIHLSEWTMRLSNCTPKARLCTPEPQNFTPANTPHLRPHPVRWGPAPSLHGLWGNALRPVCAHHPAQKNLGSLSDSEDKNCHFPVYVSRKNLKNSNGSLGFSCCGRW